MRKDLIAGNWKMHATHLEAIQMVQKFSYRLDVKDSSRVDVVVIPPFTALRSVQTVIEADRLPIGIGAQNCHWEESGAFTGEISVGMLAKLNVSYVLAGHSERRELFGEVDSEVNLKVKAVLTAGLTPILCVGETDAERSAGETEAKVRRQLEADLDGVGNEQVGSLVVAYEPIWAIGTGKTASADDAGAMAGFVRDTIRAIWGSAADDVRILYGGSVKPGNIAGLMAKRDIDGALVGGASLDPDTFASIVRYWV
jgi:triosephosphate isomerase